MYEEAFNKLTELSLFSAAGMVFTIAMGEWWKILIFAFVMFATYMTTKEIGVVAAMSFLSSAILIYLKILPTELHPILYIIIVFSLAILLWRFFGKGE